MHDNVSNDRGRQAEADAADFLTAQGLALISTNFHSRFGEIDLIMRQSDTLVFVEVKLRTNNSYGDSCELLSISKQRKLIATAKYYLVSNRCYHTYNCRFDLVAFNNSKISWIQNAFYV
jgi:putative endonuclease